MSLRYFVVAWDCAAFDFGRVAVEGEQIVVVADFGRKFASDCNIEEDFGELVQTEVFSGTVLVLEPAESFGEG